MNCFYYDEELNVYHTLIDAVQSNRKVWFYYHDNVYKNVDWKVEPYLPLKELYRIRAQQIRDTYPYVLLCYSGGYDSTNMLETFYYNNIHIDEILVVGAVSQDVSKQSDLNHNGDLYYNAFPLLRTLNLPNTKVTFVDYTKWFDDINNFSLISAYGNEWMKHIGGFHSVHNLFWYDLKKFVGATNNKETAVLFGAEKPKIEYSNGGKAFIRFSNLSFTDYGNNYHFENFHRVNFYTDDSPESIEIVKKQSHLLNQSIRAAQAINMPVPDNKKIIYEFKNPLAFESVKSRTTILSARDTFMVNKRDSDIYKIYNESVNMFRDSSLQYLRKNNIYSRPYLLE
jgi:hypothetical protein